MSNFVIEKYAQLCNANNRVDNNFCWKLKEALINKKALVIFDIIISIS